MKIKYLLLVCGLFILTNQMKAQDLEKEIDKILSGMTLEEKIGQMNQLNFNGYSEELEAKVRRGEIGSLLNIVEPELVYKLQKIAIEESRSGIPLIIGRDVIHGFKTVFPIPLGQAASFDRDLIERAGRVAAIEASEKGVHWTFTPMLDISRDARWGRIAESLGEDPYLAGELGAAMVRGFQGNDLSSPNSIAACVKHFVGYGAAEGGRDYNSTTIPIRLLRNVYLPPFQKSLEAGALTLMTSFNDNDGIPASGNDFLLKQVLRDEWNFDGFVVSDWGSIGEMVPHGFAKDRKDAAAISATAGLEMDMESKAYIDYLGELVNEGKVFVSDIDTAVKNILRVKLKLGLFHNLDTDLNQPTSIYSDSHLQTAREVAANSAILLKNENILPLQENIKIAIIGPMADAPHEQLGCWAFDGEKEHTITPLAALKEEYKNVEYIYEPALKYSRDNDKSRFEDARQAALSSDVAIVFLGEEALLSGEAHSLSDINFIGAQSELLQAIKSTGKPVVLVVIAGRPLTIERDLPYADAVLYNFHPGTMGGAAIMDVLFGKVNPNGKLPVTFPREVGQIPIHYNHFNTGRPAPDNAATIKDIPIEEVQTSVGFTSYYLDSGRDPLYPFGYGLSYTQFEYSGLELSSTSIPLGGSLTAKATIKNTGKYDGTEIVQLYVRDLVGSITRPVKELKGFERIHLKAGESKTVEFTITTDDLAFYGMDLVKKAEPGDFHLWIGWNSNEGLQSSFNIQE